MMDMNFKWTTRAEKLLVVDYWWKEQRGCCCLCGEIMKPYSRQHTSDPDAATIEHLIPRRENGPNTAGNVRLAHGLCNNALGALWQQNQHRKVLGLPPLTEKWALASASGRQRAKLLPAPQMTPEEVAARRERGSMHRARRMTAIETARWLTAQGVRGA